MATKQFYATGTFKFQNRMLKAGEPVEMDGPTGRLYGHLGKVTDKRPRVAADTPAAIADDLIEEPVKGPAKRRRRAK